MEKPSDLLFHISSLVKDTNMGIIQVLNVGSVIYRGRAHNNEKGITTLGELAPPLPYQAKNANRMNPAGISAFYGAFEMDTVIEEIKSDINQENKKKYVTIAKFILQQPLSVLDLSDLPPLPSLFDQNKRHLRDSITFFKRFIEDVSRPIIKDGMENIEYVPTQIVAEYFRHVFRQDNNNKLDGIIYPSARTENGNNCFLFLTRKDVSEDHLEERVITFLSSSVEHIPLLIKNR